MLIHAVLENSKSIRLNPSFPLLSNQKRAVAVGYTLLLDKNYGLLIWGGVFVTKRNFLNLHPSFFRL